MLSWQDDRDEMGLVLEWQPLPVLSPGAREWQPSSQQIKEVPSYEPGPAAGDD